MDELLYEKESFIIRGACYEVHNEKGSGFLESIYQECLEKEMRIQRIPFETQPKLGLVYKGEPLEQSLRPDLVCYGKIIVELKAVDKLNEKHRAQVFNYLAATKMRLGLLVNFAAHPKLEIVRIVV